MPGNYALRQYTKYRLIASLLQATSYISANSSALLQYWLHQNWPKPQLLYIGLYADLQLSHSLIAITNHMVHIFTFLPWYALPARWQKEGRGGEERAATSHGTNPSKGIQWLWKYFQLKMMFHTPECNGRHDDYPLDIGSNHISHKEINTHWSRKHCLNSCHNGLASYLTVTGGKGRLIHKTFQDLHMPIEF